MAGEKKEGGEESPEMKPLRVSSPPPSSPSSAEVVVYLTMCLIGLPVEVEVKDGSRFSGVVHTAYFKDGHGIFFKNAKKIGKGKCQTNIEIGETVDILLIQFDDLVQVIAKDFTPPAEGIFDDLPGNGTESITGDVTSQVYTRNSEIEKNMNLYASRYLGRNGSLESHSDPDNTDNHMVNVKKNSGVVAEKTLGEVNEVADVGEHHMSAEKDEESNQPADLLKERQIDCVDEDQNNYHVEELVCGVQMVHEIQPSSPSHMANGMRGNDPASALTQGTSPDNSTVISVSSPEADALGLSASNDSVSDSGASSNASRSSSPDTTVPGKRSVGSIRIKESKLNPSAKVFTPSISKLQPASSATSTIVSSEYLLNNYPVMTIAGPQPGTEMSSFPHHSSVQNKLVLCNNLVAGQDNVGAQSVQPVSGHANMRHHPVRFNGQYHPVQVGSPWVNPLPETVMVGRLGQLVYMNPVPQDAIHGLPVISPESPHAILTPYQANLPKFQGHGMQLPVNPTIVTGVNHAVFMPSFSQPFPSARPIMVPSGTGYFNCKYQ